MISSTTTDLLKQRSAFSSAYQASESATGCAAERSNAEQRDKIAQLTGGFIPREAWRTPEEQEAIDAIEPLQPAADSPAVAPTDAPANPEPVDAA